MTDDPIDPPIPRQPQIHLSTDLLEDPRLEPLETVLARYQGVREIPEELGRGDEATLVFIGLNRCFEKAGKVSEGMIGNVIWGFRESGYDERAVARGLARLRDLGYIEYTDERRQPISLYLFEPGKPVWIRYTERFRKLLVGINA